MNDADERLFLGASAEPQYLDLRYANRHGLVTGATGTGKTVTLQILAEGFSRAGVPVFCADAKGDLSGIAVAGETKDFLLERAEKIGLTDYALGPTPTVFWDLFGEQGHPVRATVSEMGPLLLSRLLELSDAQEGALNIAFRIADEEGLLLLDMKDLRALLTNLAERGSDITTTYGNVTKATVGAIQRRLLVLENQGAENFFGEPALDIRDLMRIDRDGRGFVNVLMAERLMSAPRLYATFLLWLLSELFEELPEVGDPERPKLVFFFDEAHLLFTDVAPALIEKVEHVVRLIRSKGVGVFFVTQNPLDIPDKVLAQLGNRIQHALARLYAARAEGGADGRRHVPPEPRFRHRRGDHPARRRRGAGLDARGQGRALDGRAHADPAAGLAHGTAAAEERRAIMEESPVRGIYDRSVDRESAYEMLAAAAARKTAEAKAEAEVEDAAKPRSGRRSDTAWEAGIKSVVRSVSSSVGRQIANRLMRGILGSLKL
jgi:uncharacterized protein